MPKNLPSLSAMQVVRAFKKLGFIEIRQKGSHLILFNETTGRRVTIPMHKGKDIKKLLLKKIIEIEAQMSIEDFLKFI